MSDAEFTDEQKLLHEEAWRRVNRPDGEYVLSIETYDRDLLDVIYGLNTDHVNVIRRLMKAGQEPTLVHIISENLPGFLAAITTIAGCVNTLAKRISKEKKTKDAEKKTKGKIR